MQGFRGVSTRTNVAIGGSGAGMYGGCTGGRLHGGMFWIDLSAGDAEFYTRLFGWVLQDDGVFTCEGQVVAGHGSPVPDGVPPSWTPHVFVGDPDEAASRVAGSGGRVELEPRDTPLGRTAVVTDPAGARFALRQPGRVAELVRKPSALTWTELCTPDVDAAREFYAARFGWTPHPTTMALPAGDVLYTVFVRDGEEMAGVMPQGGPYPPGGPPRWLSYVEVTDCDVTAGVAGALGGDVVVPPTDIPRVGRVAVLAGRSGETLAVMQMP